MPITYCIRLLPIEHSDGVNTPFRLRYGVVIQLPVLGATDIWIRASELHTGPIDAILGTGGLSTETVIVLLSGQIVVLGVELVL